MATETTDKLTFVTTVRDPVNGSFYVQGKTYEIPRAWAKNLIHQGVAVPENSDAAKAAKNGKSLSELAQDHRGDDNPTGQSKAPKATAKNTSK